MALIRAAQNQRSTEPWGELTWYASSTLGPSQELTAGLCRIEPGLSNPRHYHPNCEEVLHVIEGEIEHSVGDETFTMTKGDTVCIPRNTLHNAKNIGSQACLLFITFSTSEREVIGE